MGEQEREAKEEGERERISSRPSYLGHSLLTLFCTCLPQPWISSKRPHVQQWVHGPPRTPARCSRPRGRKGAAPSPVMQRTFVGNLVLNRL
ncbi:unnamed protein product [Nyctereutes procyonoides]|uniref:(raccoon dog) hypothetical protein n=1 Tax=Nyctereutes procyonoides TaxID=34880 RepID=A0A811YCG4_NYCPR|nr:unnamed protein product [Nyctereutes procyonoides]